MIGRMWKWVRDLLWTVRPYAYRRRYAQTRKELVEQCQITEDVLKRELRHLRQIDELRVRVQHPAAPASPGVPGLTAAEIERLALLAEGCGDVARAVGKVLRHGWNGQSPRGGPINRVALERDAGQLKAALRMMALARDVRGHHIREWQRKRELSVQEHLRHQPGALVPGLEETDTRVVQTSGWIKNKLGGMVEMAGDAQPGWRGGEHG
jgi:hypothetical protein